MGQLLVNGIKAGETGWRRALLRRVSNTALPEWARDVDLITSAPSSPWQRLIRGFDLAEEAGRLISKMTGRPYVRTLGKVWLKKRQAKLTESQRRRMPQKNIYLHKDSLVAGKIILLVDDVWTTGTTLLRCAQALDKAGAGEVRVLCLFRAC
jgi:predicted amidophosphoribosyltransferase